MAIWQPTCCVFSAKQGVASLVAEGSTQLVGHAGLIGECLTIKHLTVTEFRIATGIVGLLASTRHNDLRLARLWGSSNSDRGLSVVIDMYKVLASTVL